MSVREIRKEKDPILRKISKPVKEMSDRTQQLIDDMVVVMHDAYGVGLSAVQVGVLKRICVICVDPEDAHMDEEQMADAEKGIHFHTDGKDIVAVNPVVTVDSDRTQTGSEGCLSFPGMSGQVTRPYYVTLKALDRNMEEFELKAGGLLARAICHECDHMDGKLYIDMVEGDLEYYNDDEEGND